MKTNDKFIVMKHPIIEHYVSILRDKNTSCEIFRNSIKKIIALLAFEATKNVKLYTQEVETPLEKTTVKKIDPNAEFILVPILRAGLIFCESVLEFIPQATVAHIGMYRDEKTLKPVWYLDKTKKKYEDAANTFVYVLDPMLATGNSSKSVIELLVKKGIPQANITFICLFAAPVGVENIQKDFPNIKIITAALDRELNNYGYILPGVGDAGDRIFNTLD